MEGIAKRIIRNEVDPAFSPKKVLYEAWVFTDEAGRYPYMLVFEDAPKGMPGGNDVHVNLVFDGYFLKLNAYKSSRGDYWAPMLVGKARWIPEKETLPWTQTRSYQYLLYGSIGMVVLLGAYRFYRLISRSLFGTSLASTVSRRSFENHEVEPEKLSEWIDKHSAEAEDDELEEDEAD